jgi:ankyrin repeat protein
MIHAKIDHLWDQGLGFDARVFTGLKRKFMRGFDIAALEGSTDDGSGGALEAARALFRWRDAVTETKETSQTGVGLMFWCALADITDAVHALIAAAGTNMIHVVNERFLIHRPDLFSFFQRGMTALHMAAGFGSSLTVEALLEAGANPKATSMSGFDIITGAATCFGDPEMFRMWANRFPDWEWSRKEPLLLGGTAFQLAVQVGAEHKLNILKALVSVGADPVYTTLNGNHTLIGAAANPDISEETFHYLLSLPGVRDLVDVPMRPYTLGWRFRFKLTRLLVRLGSKKALFRVISLWEGQTPLCSATLNGNAVAMKMLVCEGGADTELRNARGLSALDQGRLVAGSEYYHPLLQPGKFIARVDSKAGEEKGE